MEEISISLEQLRRMIGIQVCRQGTACVVIEVLEDNVALVLQAIAGEAAIQSNQFGDARRRVPPTFTVPVLNAAHDGLHPDFLALDLIDAHPDIR